MNQRRRDERGGGIVEFALVIPLLMLFLFGIIDFGTIYSNQISVRQGVREAARQGAVANWGTSGTSCLNGTTTASADIQTLMCTTKSRIGLGNSNVYTDVWFDGGYNNSGGAIVVCAETPATSLTGITSSLLGSSWQRTKVEMTIEVVSNAETAGSEGTDPSGNNWTWCTTGSTP